MPHLFPALIAKGISKEFVAGRPALSNVDLTVQPGEIHAVVGHSGAGKSALAEIIAGAGRPTAGTLHLQGQLTSLQDQREAAAKGILYVPQSWDRTSRCSVAESLQLGPAPRRFGFADTHALHERARTVLDSYGLGDLDPSSPYCELPPGKQKLLQIAAVFSKTANLVVLDDPAAALSDSQTAAFVARLAQFQYAEAGVVYCTPRADEALQIGDQVSVLRDGQLIAVHSPDSAFLAQVRGEMLGRDPTQIVAPPPKQVWPEVAFRVEGICVEHCVYGVGLKVRRGEILGLAGLQGAGQSEVVCAIGGLEPKNDGEVFLHASGSPSRIRSREDAIRCGLGLVPDPHSRTADSTDSILPGVGGQPLPRLNAENPQRAPIHSLMKESCTVLLFDNPTRGLNVACRLEVRLAMLQAAARGIAVLAASTDVEDLMSFCDRIAVMVNGRIVHTFDRDGFSADQIWGTMKGKR